MGAVISGQKAAARKEHVCTDKTKVEVGYIHKHAREGIT